MELDLSDDQELFRDTTAKFIKASCPMTTVRELADTETGLPQDYLRRGAELGWFSMLVPEELGGGSVSGAGLRDAAIIAEERGHGLQPGPFVPMNVVAAALSRAGTAAQRAEVLPAIVAGETIATWAVHDANGNWAPGSAVTAAREGEGFVLHGTVGVVQDAAHASWILVTAGGPDGLTQFLVPASTAGITVTALEGHDITQRFASVAFANAAVPASAVVGVPGGAADDVEHLLQIAVVLSVSESLGAMDELFEMTRQYAVDRIAFGRPIGSFQAVKHQLADMSLSVESAKAIVSAALRAVQDGVPEAGEVASMAKAWLSDTGIDIAQGCFQVFGGIGFTWEHDSHLFLRRLTMNSLLYGQGDWHRERICTLQGL